MIKYFIFILCFLISGCATHTVSIPIPVSCPIPHIPPKPQLQSVKLTGNESPDVIEKAQVADIKTLSSYSNQLIVILLGYEK